MDITDEGSSGTFWKKYKYDIPVVHHSNEYWFKHRAPDGLEEALKVGGKVERVGEEPDAER